MSRVALPRDLGELWQEMDRAPQAMLYAGGTDLLVRRRSRPQPESPLICLERVEELKRLELRGDQIYLGAGCTHSRLLASDLVRQRLPILARALAVLGSPLVRNMGTLGGNLATASPAGDTLPPLYALGAWVELASPCRVKRLPLCDFILGPGRTALRPGEIILGVAVPVPLQGARHHFEKVGQRAALAISIASLAALIETEASGLVRRAHLAWGSLGPRVVTCPAAEQALEGGGLNRESLSRAARLAREAVSPIDDQRASAAYRRRVAGNLLLRLADPA
ncbi:molybdopterin dehydrogenase [Desulfocarbo indianensis]|nr:molybdopterin dehydrogenase [Desulfocarbo indianensis]